MFLATITSPLSIHSWCKSISTLSAISESLKFEISASSLQISGLNAAKTANLQIELEKDFFSKFTFQIDQNVPSITDGMTGDLVSAYGFIIPAKFLLPLFKTPDQDKQYTLKIEFGSTIAISRQYRLQIEKKSQNNVKKSFSPAYLPCSVTPENSLVIEKQYKNRLKEVWKDYTWVCGDSNNDTDNDDGSESGNIDLGNCPIFYLELDTAALKPFLDKTSAMMEDFQFEIENSASRLQFIAFLKAIKKDRVYLRQPSSLVLQCEQNIIYRHFSYDPHNKRESEDVQITVRLKELRVFINMASWSWSDGSEKRVAPHEANNNLFEIIYTEPGMPVVFVSSLQECKIKLNLVQLTDGDPSVAQRLQVFREYRPVAAPEPLFVDQSQLVGELEEQKIMKVVGRSFAGSHHDGHYNDEEDYEDDGHRETHDSDDIADTITWRPSADRPKRDFTMLDVAEEEYEAQKGEDGIARTQNVKKARGLFD